MRQVPASPARPAANIASGRLARHFTHYLTLRGFPFGPRIDPLEGNSFHAVYTAFARAYEQRA